MARPLDISLDASSRWTLLLQLWLLSWRSLFEDQARRMALAVSGGDADGERVAELEADEGLGGDLDLLAAGDRVGSCSDATAGSGADGCTFAAAQDAAKDRTDGCSATNLLRGVCAAAFAFDAV